jgi:hypothetical protein
LFPNLAILCSLDTGSGFSGSMALRGSNFLVLSCWAYGVAGTVRLEVPVRILAMCLHHGLLLLRFIVLLF